MNANVHEVITFMSQFGPVSTPKELARFVLDHRQTPIFKIQPIRQFNYGIVDSKVEGSISLYTFEDPKSTEFIHFTYGLKITTEDGYENTDLVVILGIKGFTVMLKKDAKVLFDYVEDEKVKKTDEELLLKTIEVYCK